jgi:hypothetical protein
MATVEDLRTLLAKATPGPLEIVADGLYDWGNAAFNPFRRIHVGTPKPEGSYESVITGHFVAEFKEGRGSHEVAEANAKLHVAAVNALPALLECAEMLQTIKETCLDDGCGDISDLTQHENEIRAALAKLGSK